MSGLPTRRLYYAHGALPGELELDELNAELDAVEPLLRILEHHELDVVELRAVATPD